MCEDRKKEFSFDMWVKSFSVNENMDSHEREELCKKGERVFRVGDGKYRSRAHSKREETKQNKAWQRRKWEEGLQNENFRVPEREELPQEEKYDEKTRGPELQKMPEEGEENEKVRESESEKVAEPLPTQTRNGSRPTNYLQRQIRFPEARSWSINDIRS